MMEGDELRERSDHPRADELLVGERAVGQDAIGRSDDEEQRVRHAREGNPARSATRRILGLSGARLLRNGHIGPQNCRYQLRRPGPTVAASAAPIARNVPNGSAYFISPLRAAIKAIPTTDPATDAIISVTIVSCQPMNAPIIASIFTSPI